MKVCILGAGGWGTALAVLLARKGVEIHLWARRPEFASLLAAERENPTYLPGVKLPPGVCVSSNLDQAVPGSETIILTLPSHGLRRVARSLAARLSPGRPVPVVSAAKGLEEDSLKRMSQVLTEELPSRYHRWVVVLSGPNFAAEVARGYPTTTVVASPNWEVASRVQDLLMTPTFRVYTNHDVVGVELGGALKNVYAIAVGVSDGLGLGYNARSSLITRCLAEMTRLGVAMGANPLTFAGLSGMGDLVLTCTGKYSRNRQCGLALAGGQHLQEILSQTQMVVEGVRTTRAARQLGLKYGVSMPVTDELYRVLFEGKNPADGVKSLMSRGKRNELDDLIPPAVPE